MTFFAGNSKTLLIKKQVDKDTPITDFSDALALRVYEWTKDPARGIDELQESDSSAQQGPSHVTAINPGFSFGVYGRPAELAAIAEALLGDNDDSTTVDPTTHTGTPSNDQPYYSVMDVLPWSDEAPVYNGCRCFAATFQAQDDGTTELQVTAITWVALGLTHGVAVPGTLPTPADELPFIYAEAEIKYDGAHPGTTKAFSWVINRNGARRQGDSGFRAIDATPGKLQTTGSFSRYIADDETEREVDTGSPTGTVQTAAVATHSASVLFTRGAGAGLRSVLIAAPEISFEAWDAALNLDGSPYVEVLGFRTQPQPEEAEHIAIVTVNDLATTGT